MVPERDNLNIDNPNRPLLRAFRATVAYDGCGFVGSQLQLKGRTVTGEIIKALTRVLDHPARPRLASRTDSGVHATGQVMSFRTSAQRTSEQILKALNSLLPEDIRILDCWEVDFSFHPRHSAVGKVYLYRILHSPVLDPMSRSFVLFIAEEKPFDIRKYRSEIRQLEGERDFRSFSPRLEHGENPVKTIWGTQVKRDGQQTETRLAGSGFLYQMVRRMIGLAVAVAQGREKPGAVKRAIEQPETGRVTYNAQPQGLTLEKVYYDEGEMVRAIKTWSVRISEARPEGSAR
jgi:tRNA pseudouridine38-40 synthase